MYKGTNDRNNDEYNAWRNAVVKRDKGRCQWPACRAKGRECHHIIPYAKNILLRHEVKNGILLCRRHHHAVKNKEIAYAAFFMSILDGKRK